jgi:tRNA-2-methylthio-N6-dimethylallyladenosine synthase
MDTASFFVRTYGCQMNELDSECIAGDLVERGLVPAADMESADVVVLNTCAVRDSAERKALGMLGLLARRKREVQPGLVLALCGCVAQAKREGLFDRVPELDVVCGTRRIQRLADLVEEALDGGRRCIDVAEDGAPELHVETARRSSRVKAFVSVMRGCGNYCSYCIVPYVRGREVRPGAQRGARFRGAA